MKQINTIIIWTSIFLAIGFGVKYYEAFEDNAMVYFLGGMGLTIGIVKAALLGYAESSKSKVFSQARTMFNGIVNANGETELSIDNRKIILDYKYEDLGTKATEYIIAKIDITDLPTSLREALKENYEIVEFNNRFYEIIYCTWGNNGAEFDKRITEKLEQIEDLIAQSKAIPEKVIC